MIGQFWLMVKDILSNSMPVSLVWVKRYGTYLHDKRFMISLAWGVLFLVVGVVVTFYAIVYATQSASNSVTDIILSNIPVFDVDAIFVWGPVIFWVIMAGYVFVHPRSAPFTLKSIGLFLVIRSFFVVLTHIQPFPTHIHIDTTSGILGVFTSGSDLFFSSHTGLPFLMAMIFWDDVVVRIFSIMSSVFFGAIVLMAHEHYSIDVFAAFFITYTISHIARKWFRKDHEMLVGATPLPS